MYQKIAFSSKSHGFTAGLIVESDKLGDMTIADMSRMFPYSEARRMCKLHVSPKFDNWESAFNYSFDAAS